MWIDFPKHDHILQLRSLWKDIFGDTDAFLDSFFRTAFAPDRCRCVMADDRITAVLYWLDCTMENQKLAYIYAVATHPDFRNQGLCRKLMENTHALLSRQGYASAILVPQSESLRGMYAKMGYRDAGGLHIFSCDAGDSAATLRAIGAEEFAMLRRALLPEGSVLQEGYSLAFLAEQLQFFVGEDFLLAGYTLDGQLHGVELLGCPAAAPEIVKALGCDRGTFRTPSRHIPFAMFLPLSDTAICPEYFGFAFD